MQTFSGNVTVFSFAFHTCCLSVFWWVDGTRGYHKCSLKCQRTYRHPRCQFLGLSLRVNNLPGVLKKNQFMRGMAAFWILDTPSAAAEASPGDSRRLPRVKIAHHPAVREWRMQRKQVKVESRFFSTLVCERDLPPSASSWVRDMKKARRWKKDKPIKKSLCFLYSRVNMGISDCSIFSTEC